jgi:outer membrane protein insertion porin family
MKFIKFKIYLLCFVIFVNFSSYAENVNIIKIEGNDRISEETIKTFLSISIDDEISTQSINEIIKDLYETNFFKNVDIKFENSVLTINVIENPIIQNIIYNGIKSDPLLKSIITSTKLIERSSYIDSTFERDRSIIFDNLRKNGYFFSTVDTKVEYLENNRVNLIFDINLGNKAKIRKISFLGNKVFKDKKLKNIILSEEYKFWKFISGKKFLNDDLVNFDQRLLTNFYRNNGYYNVKISSSFAKLINKEEFELIFNIDAGNPIVFGNVNISLPLNYNEENFTVLTKTLENLKGKPYSINSIEKITEQIDLLALSEEYETIKVDVIENLDGNNLNINFFINETEKFFVKKINILGNNVTRENVIRNQFDIDEGDFYNEILLNKTINNLKSLNFFKNVSADIVDDTSNDKVINISVEEKPTGEIGAAAGVGTSGSSVGFFVKENNYLGKGIALETDLKLSSNTINGKFSVINPNFNDTDKSLTTSIEAIEIDRLKDFGYKTNKTGFSFGTNFEFLDDFRLGLGNSNFYEKIETDSSASALQKKQEGNYWDSFLNLDFDYDKRNQKFKASDGFRSFYRINLPLISESNTLSNTFNYTYYTDLYKDNVTTFSFYGKSSNSLTNDDIKLTERNFLPSNRLRGFEPGRIGPKDGKDYIGGNYASSLNINTTLPLFLEENQNMDFLLFFDAANVWGVDYSETIDDLSKIRSSTGLALDWLSPLGPLNFSLALPLSKAETDKTETFRFNLGTTF